MADDQRTPDAPFLKRWSQRKLAASRESATAPESAAPNVTRTSAGPTPAASASPAAVVDSPAPTLPPVESLSFDSDFTAFLKPNVDESLKRKALRKLFADPHFNVMDGLDVYIDDYGKFVPIPPELVAQLNQAKFLFDPPKTRVNEHGHVEDVPDEPVAEAGTETTDDAPAVGDPRVAIVDNTTNLQLADAALPPEAPPVPPVPEATR